MNEIGGIETMSWGRREAEKQTITSNRQERRLMDDHASTITATRRWQQTKKYEHRVLLEELSV